MYDYESVLDRIRADERYQRNLDWGRPRKGHPEGTVRRHIAELEHNLGCCGRVLQKSNSQSFAC